MRDSRIRAPSPLQNSARCNCRAPSRRWTASGSTARRHVSFLKAGLYYADRITTVSPTYAREIQTQAHGTGLHGLLQTRTHDISGILNGVDYSIWSPSIDDAIAARYTAAKPSAKSKCKTALQERMGLAHDDDALLFGVVSRLTEQKGLDLLLSAVPDIVQRGDQRVVLGTGDATLETGMKNAAAAHPGAVAVELGFDETLSHSIIAGSDVVMVPSRFEPCGLTQLYALVYGSPPLVHRVGRLADTVVDSSLENLADDLATGFVFDTFDRAGHCRRDPPRLCAEIAPFGVESRRQARDGAELRLGGGGAELRRGVSGLARRLSGRGPRPRQTTSTSTA